jgi:TRAP-type C4-dicarboxylate transport system permease small subunit
MARGLAQVLDGYDLVIRALARVAEVLILLIAFFITAAMIVAVFFRFVLNTSIGWSDEVTSLLLAAMMFLTIGVGMHERFHIGLSMVFDRIPLAARRWLDIALHLVALVFFVLIGLGGIRVAAAAWGMSLSTLPLPRGLFMASAPLGSGFAAMVCVNNILKVARGIDTPHGQRGD